MYLNSKVSCAFSLTRWSYSMSDHKNNTSRHEYFIFVNSLKHSKSYIVILSLFYRLGSGYSNLLNVPVPITNRIRIQNKAIGRLQRSWTYIGHRDPALGLTLCCYYLEIFRIFFFFNKCSAL